MLFRMAYLLTALSATFMVSAARPAEAPQPATVEPKADQLLRKTSDFLDTLKRFKLVAETTTDYVLSTGQKLQHEEVIDVAVQRPDRLRVDATGDRRNLQLIYDGKQITLLETDRNFYAQMDVPATIDAALDQATDKFGLRAPLSDLLHTDMYKLLAENIESGFYVGMSKVRGVQTHHLAFRTAEVDYQVWIEDSRTPLPRKVVITLKWMTGAPQYTAWLSWDLSPKLPATLYRFVPPANAHKIQFLPLQSSLPPR
jgi:hypothetical protein